MKNSLKKIILLSIIALILPIMSFGQTTWTVTQEQINTANKIFTEHKYLLRKDSLQQLELAVYKAQNEQLASAYLEQSQKVQNLSDKCAKQRKKIIRRTIINVGLGILVVLLII